MMKKLAVLLFLIGSIAFAGNIQGSYSTGFYMGTPFWNSDNFSDGNEIDVEDSFMRTINQLRVNGKFGTHFKFALNARRSDGFQGDNHLSETKFYQAYGQYSWSSGDFKLGRFVPFNRWIWGSVDGASAAYQVTDAIKVSAFGGMHLPYGLLYDSDNSVTVAYADMGIKFGKYRTKLKVFNNDDVTKVGADFYGRTGKLRFSGNYGFDVTESQLADGGLGLLYLLNPKWNISANYRLFRTMPWNLGHTEFKSYLIERYLVGIGYKIFNSYTLDFKQMLTMTSDHSDYLTYLTLSQKYFTVGVSYLGGESEVKRMGLIVGANYTLFKGFNLSAGVAPVNYLLQNKDDALTSFAYYGKISYRLLQSLCLRMNFNYYQDNPALQSQYRGGLQINYFFGS